MVSFPWLAERFVSYYWPLTVKFRVRQSTDPTKDPVIMKFIRAEVEALKLQSDVTLEQFTKQHGDRYEQLLDRCVHRGGCFDEVVPRFHNLRSQETKDRLYDYDPESIHLRDGARSFLKSHQRVLELLAVGSWVRFTEQYTTAPRLYEKIAGTTPERRHQKYRTFLSDVQGATCFYCERAYNRTPHVDHFIPWTFVLEDRIWNLVLACEACNGDKSDQTPADTYIEKLVNRNSHLLERIAGEGTQAIGAGAIRDLRGLTASRLEETVRTLVASCRADAFGTWPGPAALG